MAITGYGNKSVIGEFPCLMVAAENASATPPAKAAHFRLISSFIACFEIAKNRNDADN
jgi:hypothetical protein